MRVAVGVDRRALDVLHDVVGRAVLGQAAIQQAREFTAAVEVTGLIVAKLDGTARGGAVFGIREALGLPVRYIGTGESLELLEPFDPASYVDAIVGKNG